MPINEDQAVATGFDTLKKAAEREKQTRGVTTERPSLFGGLFGSQPPAQAAPVGAPEEPQQQGGFVAPVEPIDGGMAAPQTNQAIFPSDMSIPPPDEPAVKMNLPKSVIYSNNIAEFLFGTELAAAGMKWDGDSWSWSLDNIKQQWQEEPVWTAVTLAMDAASIAFPIIRSAKAGKLAELFDLPGFKSIMEGSTEPVNYFDQVRHVAETKGLDMMSAEKDLLQTVGKFNANIPIDEISDAMVKEARSSFYEDSRRAVLMMKRSKLRDYERALNQEIIGGAEARGIQIADADGNIDMNAARQSGLYDQAVSAVQSKGFTPVKISMLEGLRLAFDDKFGNEYWKIVNDPSPAGQERRRLADSLDGYFKAYNIDALREHFDSLSNDKDFVKNYYKYHLSKVIPDVTGPYDGPAYITKAIEDISAPWKGLQQKMKDTGFLTDDAPDIHLIGMTKEGADMNKVLPLSILDMKGVSFRDALRHPTLMPKKKELSDLWTRVEDGNLKIEDVKALLAGYVNDHMLYFNHAAVRDLATHPMFARNADDLIKSYGGSARLIPDSDWVSLDDIFARDRIPPARMIRMINKKDPTFLGTNNALPYLRRDIYDALVGDGGMFHQSKNSGLTLIDLLTTVYKTSKTSLNPATHIQNILGNFAFLSQAGFNLSDPDNMRLIKDSGALFNKIHKVHEETRAAFGAGAPLSTVTRAIIDKLDDLPPLVYKGRQFKPSLLMTPEARAIIEDSSFESAEGLPRLKSLERQAKAQQNPLVASTATFFNRVPTFLKMDKAIGGASKLYMGEDVVPKLALFIQGHLDGLSIPAAASRVARRLPMYGTTGAYIREGRRHIFPWVSFPVEALRITKNNLMDHPLRTLPWMHGTKIMESLMYATGLHDTTYEESQEAKSGLPMWAQKYDTFITGTPEAAGAATAAVGGMAGWMAGGMLGGPTGAAAGASLGLLAGAGAVQALKTFDEMDQLRGAFINFIPSSSFLPQVRSPEFEVKNFTDITDYIPAEPLAVLMPLIEVAQGRSQFGDIKTTGPVDVMSKTLAGFIGFLSPPWIQKYGFKTTTPDVGLVEYGLNMGNITSPQIVNDIDPTNVSRFLIDFGLSRDSVTGKIGNPIIDVLLNSGMGVFKSYPASPETYVSNVSQNIEAKLQNMRNYYSRNLRFYMMNGYDAQAMEALQQVYQSFNVMNPFDPEAAQAKWQRWIKAQAPSILRHPRLRSMSLEELDSKLDNAMKESATNRLSFRDATVKTLKAERMARAYTARAGRGTSGNTSVFEARAAQQAAKDQGVFSSTGQGGVF